MSKRVKEILSWYSSDTAGTRANIARILNHGRLAGSGKAATPYIVRPASTAVRDLGLSDAQLDGLRHALIAVVERGTAAASRRTDLDVAGKTGTAQNPPNPDHAWFVGFAPADDPQIVVAVFVEFGLHGSAAARMATKVIERYLKKPAIQGMQTEGD